MSDINQKVIEQMQFPDEITRQRPANGPETELEWELGWARTFLKRCGLIDNPQPVGGFWELTQFGTSRQWLTAAKMEYYDRRRLEQRRDRGGSSAAVRRAH